jgi:metal-responsive CopG/Arc/MetJ family transcriptional regulator
MAKKKRTHARADGETTMTVSLPQTLLNDIDDFADADERSRSKWVVRELRKIIDAKKAATQRAQSEGRGVASAERRSSTSIPTHGLNEEPRKSYDGAKKRSR